MRNAFLSLGLALALSASAATQSLAPLPPNRTATVVGHFTHFQLLQMLQNGLNSAGDQMWVEFEFGASVPIAPAVNVGGRSGLEVRATRLEQGAYELAISREDAASIGVELTQGNEGSIAQGLRRDVLFVFPTAIDAAAGLTLFGQIGRVAVEELKRSFETHAVLAQQLGLTVRDALISLQDTRLVAEARLRSYRAASATLRATENALRVAKSAVSKARSRVRWAERRVARLPRWLRGTARRVLSSARRALSYTHAGLRRAESNVARTRNQLAQKRYAWTEAKKDVDLEARLLDSKRAAEASARQTLDSVRNFVQATQSALTHMSRHFAGIETEFATRARLEASLDPAGVQIPNVGMSAAAQTGFHSQLRWLRAVPGKLESLELEMAWDLGFEVQAGAVVGARSEGSDELSVAMLFERQAQQPYRLTHGETRIDSDLQAHAILGALVTAESGVGQESSIVMSFADWQRALQSSVAFAREPSLSNLHHALRGIRAEFSLQSRRIHGLAAGFGAGVAGLGFEMSGAMRWADRGPQQSRYVDAGTLLAELLDLARAKRELSILSQHLR
jgi:hypothetical protein